VTQRRRRRLGRARAPRRPCLPRQRQSAHCSLQHQDATSDNWGPVLRGLQQIEDNDRSLAPVSGWPAKMSSPAGKLRGLSECLVIITVSRYLARGIV